MEEIIFHYGGSAYIEGVRSTLLKSKVTIELYSKFPFPVIYKCEKCGYRGVKAVRAGKIYFTPKELKITKIRE